MVDGVHFADHLCLVALSIDITATKHPLALVEGSTENATPVRGLLVGPRDRGLDTTKPVLAVRDGAKALAAVVSEALLPPSRHPGLSSVTAEQRGRVVAVPASGCPERRLRSQPSTVSF